MKYNFTNSGVRSMYLLTLLLFILSFQQVLGQCDLDLTETHVEPLCALDANGSVTLTISGGTAPFYVEGYDLTEETTITIESLSAGDHIFRVIDANGCEAWNWVMLAEPEPLTIVGVASDEPCFGAGIGTAFADVFGGMPPYNYSWDHAGETSSYISDLFAGTYTVHVADAKGCNADADITITEPDELVVSLSVVDAVCFGETGSVHADVVGGTVPYTYQWWPSIMETGSDLSALYAGEYGSVITDQNNCLVITEFTIAEPAQLIPAIASLQDISCYGANDGAVTLTASGGVAPYMFGDQSWPEFTSLEPGDYSVSIVDATGCAAEFQYSIHEPLPLELQMDHVNAQCGEWNGQATAIPSGGTPEYTYEWWPLGATSSTIENLYPGSFIVTVTDAHNCQISDIVEVESDPCAVVVTSMFTPGSGDTFRVHADDVRDIQLKVYDMHGQQLFTTTDVSQATETGWDGRYQGKVVPAGWYIWTLQGSRSDGKPLVTKSGEHGRVIVGD